MLEPTKISAGVHAKIAARRKKIKLARVVAAGAAAACLCAFATVGLAGRFARALPAADAAGAKALEQSGSFFGQSVLCGGATFTLEGAVQDGTVRYLLLTTDAEPEQMEQMTFFTRPAAAADPPAFVQQNCGVAYYAPPASGQPGELLLCSERADTPETAAATALWLRCETGQTPERARLDFTLSATAPAAEHTVQTELRIVGDKTYRLARVALSPYSALVFCAAGTAPGDQTLLAGAAVTAGGQTLPATARWFAQPDGSVGLLLRWQAALDPAGVTALAVNDAAIRWP